MIKEEALQVLLLILFTIGYGAAVIGIFLHPGTLAAFLTVFVVSAGGIVVVAPSRIKSIRIGFGGVQAELRELKDRLSNQENILHDLVIYSLAEIIYRELLWKIGHDIEVKRDGTLQQLRWLTLLFDHGLLTAKDWNKPWREFEKIEKGEDLSELYKATPAGEYLMQLRGRPAPVGATTS